LESIAETQPQLNPALLRLSAMISGRLQSRYHKVVAEFHASRYQHRKKHRRWYRSAITHCNDSDRPSDWLLRALRAWMPVGDLDAMQAD
jgi:hypothetical protein